MKHFDVVPSLAAISILLALQAMPAFAQTITNGADESEVYDLLGRPHGRMRSGNTVIFSYDRGLVTLVDGQVTTNKLVSEEHGRQAAEKRKREAAARRTTRAITPAQTPVVQPPTTAPKAGDITPDIGDTTPGVDADALAQQITETEQAIAIKSDEPLGTKQETFLRDRELERLHLKLDLLNETQGDPNIITNKISLIERRITEVSRDTNLTKQEGIIQKQELRRLDLELDLLRELKETTP